MPPFTFSDDFDMVEVFNPSLDLSYNHISLLTETINLLFPISSLDSISLILSHEVILPLQYSKFKCIPRCGTNWNTWITHLKFFMTNIWRRQGLYHLIPMYTIDTTFSLDIFEGIVSPWALPAILSYPLMALFLLICRIFYNSLDFLSWK